MSFLLVDTGITEDINEEIIIQLTSQSSWRYSADHFSRQGLEKFSDTGFIMMSYFDSDSSQQEKINQECNHINALGNLITKVAFRRATTLSVANPRLVRFIWNYYNPSSTGVLHSDIKKNVDGKFLSMIYYLNDCDGGTEIEGEKVYCRAGQAVIFNSRKQHKGFGPFNSKYKICLNAMVGCDDYFNSGNDL